MTHFNDHSSVLNFLHSRKSGSAKSLGEPAPSRDQLDEILEIAVRVPDHGKLAPWRFILIEGEARQQLGVILKRRWAELHPDHGEATLGFVAKMLERAPQILVVVSTASPHPKVVEWEQELSAGAVCYNILLAATALGFQPQWSTDWLAYDPVTKEALGVRAQEKVAGLIYLGTTTAPLEERPRPDPKTLLTVWSPS